MTIGQYFKDAKQVIILVQHKDGSQHAFQLEPGTVRWEHTGMADGPELGYGSAGRLTVEGRFHRKNRSPLSQSALDEGATQGEIGP